MIRRPSRRRGRTLEDAVDEIPDHLLRPTAIAPGGQMVGLAQYVGELERNLQRAMGRDDVPVIDAMFALGIPPAEWCRELLS